MIEIVFASGNEDKINELQALLSSQNIRLIPQKNLGVEEVPETATTFVENALIKARNASKKTGLPAIADDSGMLIKALNGAPGLYSARYAGEHATMEENRQKVMAEVKNIPKDQREACFYCALVFIRAVDDTMPLIAEGVWRGEVLDTPRGDNGFGYDPILFLPELQKTAAQLPKSQKNTMSHRGIALSALLKNLPEKLK